MSVFLQLAMLTKGPLSHHRTVSDANGTKKLQIYFSAQSRQRFVVTEERFGNKGKKFTEIRQEPPGKSLIAIEGECEQQLLSK